MLEGIAVHVAMDLGCGSLAYLARTCMRQACRGAVRLVRFAALAARRYSFAELASLRTLVGGMASVVSVAITVFTLCVFLTSCHAHNTSIGPHEQPLMLNTRTGSNGTQHKIAGRGPAATVVTGGVSSSCLSYLQASLAQSPMRPMHRVCMQFAMPCHDERA